MHRCSAIRIAALLFVVAAEPLAAEQVFSALLDGGAVMPPNGSAAGAFAKVTLSDDATSVRISYLYAGLDAGDITAVHVHDAPAGTSGDVVLDVGVSASPRLNVVAAVPAGQLDDLLAGEWYLDVHTTAFPDGELRGQVAPSSTVATARLNPLEQVPSSSSRAHGFGRLDLPLFGSSIGFASARVHGLTTSFVSAHVHGRAFPSREAGIVIDLGAPIAPGATGDATFSLDVSQQIDLSNGLLYLDVHTTAFPNGELRGQVAQSNGTLYVARVDGTQPVLPTASTATGQSVLVFYPQALNAKLSLRFDGLTSNNTANGLYTGQAGQIGGLIVPIAASGATSATVVNQNVATDLPGPTDLDDFLAMSSVHVRVDSQDFPDGEIRGQYGQLDFVHADGFE